MYNDVGLAHLVDFGELALTSLLCERVHLVKYVNTKGRCLDTRVCELSQRIVSYDQTK